MDGFMDGSFQSEIGVTVKDEMGERSQQTRLGCEVAGLSAMFSPGKR